MEYITNFLGKHEYILPVLCILIIALLIAIIISLLVQMQKNETALKAPEEKRTLLTVSKEALECELAEVNKQKLDWERRHEKLSSSYKELEDNYSKLEKKLVKKEQEYTKLKLKFQESKEQNNNLCKELDELKQRDESFANSKQEQKELLDDIEDKFFSSTDQLICTHTFLNPSECAIHYYIEEELKKQIYFDKFGKNNLYVFPQVALNSLFELTTVGKDISKAIQFKGKNYISKFYRCKSVDFLICVKEKSIVHVKTNEKTTQEKAVYSYRPLLGIEFDGPDHDKQKQKEKDREKDQLFKAFNLPLERYHYALPRKDVAKKIREHLLDEKTL